MQKFRRGLSRLIILSLILSLVSINNSYADSLKDDKVETRVKSVVVEKSKKGNAYKENYFLIKDFSSDGSAFREFKLEVEDLDEEAYKKIKGIRFKNKHTGREARIELVDKEFKEIIEGLEDKEIKEIYDKGFIALDKSSDGLELKGRIGSQAGRVLSYGNDFKEGDNSVTAAGNYEIFVDYKNSTRRSEKIQLKIVDGKNIKGYKEIYLRDRPRVIRSNPHDGEKHVNYNNLYREFTFELNGRELVERGYYLELEYEDFDKELSLIDEDIKGSQVTIRALGQDESDISSRDKRIQFDPKRSRVYIPLKDKLDEKLEYELIVREASIVKNTAFFTGEINNLGKDGDRDGEDGGNNVIISDGLGNKFFKIRFTSNYRVIPDKVYEGSIVEDYDIYYPIIVEGKDFTHFTDLYFRDELGKLYEAERLVRRYEKDKELLLIYLPRDKKLKPGNYTMIFRNGKDFQSELEFGDFSVIKKGHEKFEGGYYIRDKDGIILSLSSLENKDRIDLSESSKRRIDLDTLTGPDTWTREIVSNKSEDLFLKSRDFQLDFKGLNLEDFQVGVASPVVRDQVLKDLRGKELVSDVLEIYGENLDFQKVRIDMVYQGGDIGQILRYDEFEREYVRIDGYEFSDVDGRVSFESRKPGIFVITR